MSCGFILLYVQNESAYEPACEKKKQPVLQFQEKTTQTKIKPATIPHFRKQWSSLSAEI